MFSQNRREYEAYDKPTAWRVRTKRYASVAVTGRVSIQAQIIRPAMPHLTALSRLVAPTPIIEPEMTCVVESGIPQCVAASITAAAVVCAAKPWTGCILTSLWPMVLIIRQPPAAVPAAIVTAQMTLTQTGI